MPRHAPPLRSLLALLLLAGCATPPPASDPGAVAEYQRQDDPLEPTNRKLYAVSNFVDSNVMHPVASAYRDNVPEVVRTHVHNVLSNLGNPAQFANDVLQGSPRKAGTTLVRLVINTTAGVGGIFDVASGLGFPDHDNDFGLTLAVWGVPEGPFLFLPVLGPTDLRDAIGYGANTVLDPLTWVSFGGSSTFGWARYGTGAVDGRARVLPETDSIQKTALDQYATFRSLYQQHREGEVEEAQKDQPPAPGTVPSAYARSRPANGEVHVANNPFVDQ